MKILLASVVVSGFVVTAVAQRQSGFVQPAAVPPATPTQNNTAAQNTTPANQGVATNPTGDAAGAATTPTTGVNSGVAGQPLTNSTGASAFNAGTTNQAGATTGTAPLFLNIAGTTITDANGQPLGTLQQLVLSPNGSVNFGLVNVGGRLVPVPWQLIVTGGATARGSLALNTDRSTFQSAPPVLMGQLPSLTQDDVAQQIFNHFGLQTAGNTQPTVVNTTNPRGGTGGPGITITGGSTNTVGFGANTTAGLITNTGGVPNTISNQPLNTSGGLLSPTGRTNGIYDGFNSGPGSTDRFGPRQNANPTQPALAPGVNNPGTGQRQP